MAITAAYQLLLDASQYIAETQKAKAQMMTFGKTAMVTRAQYVASMRAMGTATVALGKELAILGAIGIAAPTIAFAMGIKVAGSYQNVLSRIAFWTDATAEETRALNNIILKTSSTWAITAQTLMENAEAFAKIDMQIHEIGIAMDVVAKTVRASGEDMADVTSIVRIAYEAFGVQVTEMEDLLSRLTYIAKMTSMDIGDMAYTLARAGAIAELSAVSIDQLAIATALFRARGMEASETSTALRRILAETIKHAERYDEAFRLAGISSALVAKTGEIAFDDFIKVLGRLTETTEGQILLTEILGKTSIRAMGGISALADMSDRYFEIQMSLGDATGYLDKMADQQMLTMSALTDTMKVSFTNFMLSNEALEMMGDSMAEIGPYIQEFAQSLGILYINLLKMFVEMAPFIGRLMGVLGHTLNGFIPIISLLSKIGMSMLWVLERIAPIIPVLVANYIAYRLAVKLHTLALLINKHAHLAQSFSMLRSGQIMALLRLQLSLTNVAYATMFGVISTVTLATMIATTENEELKNKLRTLQYVIITMTGVIIGAKVAMWAYTSATVAAMFAQHSLIGTIVLGVAAAAIAITTIYYLTSEIEKMSKEMFKASDAMEEYEGPVMDAIDSNYELADSFGALSGQGREFYEVFLILTEDTAGYIIQMGKTIRTTSAGAVSDYGKMDSAFKEMVDSMKEEYKKVEVEKPEYEVPKAPPTPKITTLLWDMLWPERPWKGREFQFGGVVPGPVGMPVPIIAHGQEEIISAGRVRGERGLAGMSIINNFDEVNIYEEADLPRFGRKIGREIQRRLP